MPSTQARAEGLTAQTGSEVGEGGGDETDQLSGM